MARPHPTTSRHSSRRRTRRARRALAASAVSLLFVTGLMDASPAAAVRPTGWALIAHRGYPLAGHTEDTIPSLAAARRDGASSVEVDLRLSSDLGILVMHDPSLDRTTTCRGLVADQTLHDIRASCRGKVGGEPLPTADRVLSWASEKRMNVVLDIKTDPAARWTVEQFAALDRLITSHGMTRRVVLMSFEADYLANAKAVDPALTTDWIADGWPGVDVIAANCDVVNVYAGELTVNRVTALHAAGVRVFGRKTNARTDWERLRRVGADGLLTDRTPAYVAWLERR